MFCGLPLGVAVDPMVIEKASKRNVGPGSMFIDLAGKYTIGGPMRATVSLTTIAERKPMVSERKTSTECVRLNHETTKWAIQSRRPGLSATATMLNIPTKNNTTSMSIASAMDSRGTRPEITTTNAVKAMRLHRGVSSLLERSIIPAIKNAKTPSLTARSRRSSKLITLRALSKDDALEALHATVRLSALPAPGNTLSLPFPCSL